MRGKEQGAGSDHHRAKKRDAATRSRWLQQDSNTTKNTQKTMAKYRIYKNTNVKSAGYNKYYAHKAAGKLVELPELVQHMAGHNTAFSEGVIRGVITDMVRCVRELAYEGNQVKIENLGIFQVSMRSKGVTDPTKFNAQTDIKSKWQGRPTGDVLTKNIETRSAGGAVIVWEELKSYDSPRDNQPQP